MKNSDVVEYHGTINGNCAGWPYHVVKEFYDKMILYQRILLQFPQPIKHLLFYFLNKNCKLSLISIYFIAPVYKLFDNLSYSELIKFFSGGIQEYFFLRFVHWIYFCLIFSPQINALILIGYYIFVKENKKHLLRQGNNTCTRWE